MPAVTTKASETDAVTTGQKAARKARRTVSGMSRPSQQELVRHGMALLYQASVKAGRR